MHIITDIEALEVKMGREMHPRMFKDWVGLFEGDSTIKLN